MTTGLVHNYFAESLELFPPLRRLRTLDQDRLAILERKLGLHRTAKR